MASPSQQSAGLAAGMASMAINTTGAQQSGHYECRATQVSPAWDLLIPGEPVAVDIEFQIFKHSSWEKWRHRVGQVAIVNSKGETVLDVYAAYPKADGVEKRMPPREFGVTNKDLLFSNGAVPAHKVERWVKQIVEGRTVILHGGKHDLTAFVIEADVFANSQVVDTQREYSHLQFDGTPGLKTVASIVLGISIQDMGHSPVEDAQMTLKLWQQKHSYDRDAAVAKIEAERKNTPKGRKSNAHDNRRRPAISQRNASPEVVAQPLPPPNATDADEFPPLAAPASKRR